MPLPKSWTTVESNETTLGFQGNRTWQPEIYFSDVSSGAHERVGASPRMKQDAELKEARHGSVPGRQTVLRAELTALVVLAENIDTAGDLRGQSGCPVPIHFHCRAGHSEAWNRW